MRAKAVDFHRGGNPLDTLGIGYLPLKEFRNAARSGDAYFPFDKILTLLEDRYITEDELKEFLVNVSASTTYHRITFTHHFIKSVKVKWLPEKERLTVQFHWDGSKSIKTVLQKTTPGDSDYNTRKMVTTAYDGLEETTIRQGNVFRTGDDFFNPIMMFNQIIRVFNEAQINIE